MAKPQAKSSGRVKPGQAKVSGKKVKVNFKGVEAGTRKAVRVPEGDYLFKVKKAEAVEFKSGNEGVTWVFEFVDGPGKGSPVYHNSVFTETSLWSFKGIVQALRPKVKIKDDEMEIDLSKLVGRTVAGSVIDDEYNDKIKSIINDFFGPELLDEDDEDEDDEEEAEDDEADEPEDDEEDDEDEEDEEEDEEDEEEEENEDVDYYELSAPDLRQYAADQGIKVKGMKKAGILEALDEMFSEEEDEEEDWDDEVDLEDDDL